MYNVESLTTQKLAIKVFICIIFGYYYQWIMDMKKKSKLFASFYDKITRNSALPSTRTISNLTEMSGSNQFDEE